MTPKPTADPAAAFGTIDDLDCRGRRVFLRVDPFVVDELDDDGQSEDAASSASAVPTESAESPEPSVSPPPARLSSLRRLLELEARVIVATHVSRDAAAESGIDSVEELAARLSERLGVEAFMPDECVGDAAVRVIHALRPGQICVLPDLASSTAEQKNDEGFARALASYLDAYVGDAFASSHLEYASLSRLPRLAPRRALGYRARHELTVLSDLFAASRGSVVMVLGGSDLGPKMEAVQSWLPRLNHLCVGGGAALTLLVASGRAPAHVSAETERFAEARSLLTRARDLGVRVTLPVDLRVRMPDEEESRVVATTAVPERATVIDVGPDSLARMTTVTADATRLLWWGPLGRVERGGTQGSQRVAEWCAAPSATSVVLGGATRRFVRQLPKEVVAGIDLVSTGTTAAMTLLSGRRLPAIEALRLRR